MITYKITPLFNADWWSLYPAIFGDNIHCASIINGNVAQFSFEDDTVVPADLGPLVKIEVVTESE